jgi:hypothetical protein
VDFPLKQSSFLPSNSLFVGNMKRHNVVAVLLAAALSACDGGDSGGSTPAPVSASAPVAPIVALKLASVEFAQTHILPEAGLTWTLSNDTSSLKLVGKRDTLVLVTLGVTDAANPVINATANGTPLGKVALSLPSALPPTEAGGAPNKAGVYSAVLPAAWLVKGLSLTISADNYLASTTSAPAIGAASVLELNIIPFYLFGANDENSETLASIQAPSVAVQNDLYDKWPVSELKIKPFNGGRIDMPSIVVAPRPNSNNVRQPAYLLSNMDEQQDGYAAMDSVLTLTKLMRQANGEAATNTLYYGPMLVLNAAGKQKSLGGGLGSNGGGVGDTAYSGIFLHEMGHAFGLPHANDGYVAGKYPYVGGSTKGSVWGYNQIAKLFLNLLVDKTAETFASCTQTNQINAAGQCYKQDPMQSGHQDRTSGSRFGTFSDFNISKIQQWFEGKTTTDTLGKRTYSGGVIFPDMRFASGYARWDSIDGHFFEYTPALYQGGIYGINDDLPIAKAVPVYTIMLAYSQARSAGASLIYAPIKYTGNLIKTFDPTNSQDLADFSVDTGKFPNYCKAAGCDYSVRVTYSDGSMVYRVLKDGFRSWLTPTAPVPASASDPLSTSSLRRWAINVPADKNILKIELLDTPTVWRGLPASPTVLLSRSG